ncbi:MAG: cupin domain-containing protein [Chloroflexota bacterium]|jgi:quercetin dioxygenase-like cupin family protein
MEKVITLADIEPKPVPMAEGHHGGTIWYVFNRDNIGTEGLRLHVQEYPPGGYTEGHDPHLDMEQAYYIISGTMLLHIAGKEYRAGPGSFVFIPRGATHGHRSVGEDKLVFLTINVPIRDGGVPPLPSKT